jgi:plastocyanin
MTRARARFVAFAALAFGAAITGCSHADYSSVLPGATATPSSSASASPTATATAIPATCGTAVPGSVYIAIGSYIEPETPIDPAYGTLYGYALTDSVGDYPLNSGPIDLKPGDTIQFVNVDPAAASGTDGTSHSAAGFQSASFPSDYTFPAAASDPVGSTLSTTALWSTGEIPAQADTLCYSQTLTVPASGTYYFGDVDFYDSTSMRDVIVVSSSAAQRRSRRR